MVFHHVGVAVPDIEAALDYYVKLFGFEQIAEPVEVPPQKVRVCFIRAEPGVMIELVEGIGEGSPVSAMVEHGAKAYHLCYQVEDLDDAVRRLKAGGCLPIRRFELRAHGLRRFAFLLTPDQQLFELCEPDPEQDGPHTGLGVVG
jgi:methylmalonyl-CoA/ethylmalonyl-CoA epimerase